MHKEKSRALIQHVRMQRCDLNARLPQLPNYWIDLAGNQHEVARDCYPLRSRLKVDRSGRAHESWDLGSVGDSDLFFPRNSYLQHAAALVTFDTKSFLHFAPIERRSGWWGRRHRTHRRATHRQSFLHRTGEL